MTQSDTLPGARQRRWFIVLALLFGLIATQLAGQVVARAATAIVTFESPPYSVGQVVSSVPGATLSPTGTVYQPSAPTASGANAVRAGLERCNDTSCSNGANRLSMAFSQSLDRVSLRVGAVNGGFEFCFPENNPCEVWARLIAFDAAGTALADSRDVLVASLDVMSAGSILSTLTVNDPAGRIRSATLTLGTGLWNSQHEHGNPGAWGIDDLSLSVPDAPPSPPPLPAPPAITIDTPTPGQVVPFPYTMALTGQVSAPAGLFGFCIRLNNSAPPSAAACNEGGRVRADGTFSIPIDTLAPAAGQNVVYVFAYDLASRLASADRSFVLGTSPAPTVVITTPTPTTTNQNESDPVGVAGRLSAPGGIDGFCITINSPGAPARGDCTRKPPDSPVFDKSYTFFDAVPAANFRRGANEVRLTLYDRFGQRATATVVFFRLDDLRIVGVELTQGIQSREGFIQPQYPGLGLVDDAADLPGPGNYADRHRYVGTRLVLRGKTVLRVFVNHPGPGTTPSVPRQLFLSAAVPRIKDGSLRPIGAMFPDYGPSEIPSGPPGLTVSARGGDLAAFTFTLPRQWHEEIASAPGGQLELNVRISGGAECPACEGNNRVVIDNIHFGTSPHGAVVQPVEIVYRDGANKLQRPKPADEAFKDIEQVIPHTEDGLRVTPFIGQVDATDLIKARDAGALTGEQVTSEIFGRVADFARGANPPDRKVIGVMAPGMNVRGVEAPVTFCCDFKPAPLPRWEPIAIGAEDRLMESLLHEYLHEHGLYHAGLLCGADLAINWPPDNKGELQGFGLDRRDSMRNSKTGAYRLLTPSSAKPFHDVMSYCSEGETDAWLSPRNWNALGSPFPNGAIPDSVFLGQSTAVVNAEKGQGVVTVSATLHADGRLDDLQGDYKPGDSYSYGAASSPYTAVAYGADRKVVAEAPMFAPPLMTEGSTSRTLNAALDVPSGVSRISILHKQEILGTKAVGAHPPIVRLLSPRSGAIPGNGSVQVNWSASDADGDQLTARLEFAADGTEYKTIATGLSGGSAAIPGATLTRSRNARLRVVVSDGYHEEAAVSGPLQTSGPTEALRIVAPTQPATVSALAQMPVTAQLLDLSGKPVEKARYRWYMGKRKVAEGRIASFKTPKPATYILKVIATKKGMQTLTDSMEIRVK
jgi:hypothetical protein